MFKMKIIFSFLVFICSSLNAKDYLIKQGDIKVNIRDLTAYSYTIPVDRRLGFFQSSKRLSDSLLKLLQLKQLANYGAELIDEEELEKLYQSRISRNKSDFENNNLMEESKIIALNKFIKLLTIADLVKGKLKVDLFENVNLSMLAKEKFILNSSEYVTRSKIDYKFLTIYYDKTNKNEKLSIANEYLLKIENNSSLFDEIINDFVKYDDVEMASYIKNNVVTSYNEFAQKLLNNNIGLISSPIIENSRIFVVEVVAIHKGKQRKFNEVKQEIIDSISPDLLHKLYADFINKLTNGDELEINQDAINNINISEI